MAFRKLPKKIFLQGNKDLAVSHIGVADSLLNLVENQAGFQGLKQNVMRRELRDGSILEASTCHGMSFVKIWSPFAPVEEKEKGGYCWIEILNIEGATFVSAHESAFIVRKNGEYWLYRENTNPDVLAAYTEEVLPITTTPHLVDRYNILATDRNTRYFSPVELWSCATGSWVMVKQWEESDNPEQYQYTFISADGRSVVIYTDYNPATEEHTSELWSCVTGSWAMVKRWVVDDYCYSYYYLASISKDGRSVVLYTGHDTLQGIFAVELWSCVTGSWVMVKQWVVDYYFGEYRSVTIVSTDGRSVVLYTGHDTLQGVFTVELWSCATGSWVMVKQWVVDYYFGEYHSVTIVSTDGRSVVLYTDYNPATEEHTVELWSCVTGSWAMVKQWVVGDYCYSYYYLASISKDGRSVVLYTTGYDASQGVFTVELWSCATGSWVMVKQWVVDYYYGEYRFYHFTISEDGRSAVIYYRNFTTNVFMAELWSCATGSWVMVKQWEESDNPEQYTFISADGRSVVIYTDYNPATEEHTSELWSCVTGSWAMVKRWEGDWWHYRSQYKWIVGINQEREIIDMFTSEGGNIATPEPLASDRTFTSIIDLFDTDTSIVGTQYITSADVSAEKRRRRAILSHADGVTVIKRTREDNTPCLYALTTPTT